MRPGEARWRERVLSAIAVLLAAALAAEDQPASDPTLGQPPTSAWWPAGASRAAKAVAYRDGCSCVYAAVVRASPAALTRIAARPQVRAVDPAPDVRRLDRAVFRPPLPEQQDVVRPPADDAIEPD